MPLYYDLVPEDQCHTLVRPGSGSTPAVRATINGKSVAGKSFPRDWVGRKSTTAFLAFSETWIKA
jgi:hypothetical protein